jgi:Skp family chaperone for outer membrane proteins
MRNAERFVVYAGLALSVALAAGWRGPGAVAGAVAPTVVAPAPMKIGTVDVLLVLERAFGSEQHKSARDAEAAKLRPMQDMLTGMKARLEKMDQNAPEFKAEVPVYQQKVQEFQGLEAAYVKFQAGQVIALHKVVAEACQRVATAGGYSHIFASRPLGGEWRSQNVDSAVQEVLQRGVIVGESGTDITEGVLKDLKLEAVPAPTPAPASPATPSAPVSPVPTTPPK